MIASSHSNTSMVVAQSTGHSLDLPVGPQERQVFVHVNTADGESLAYSAAV